MGHKPRNMRGLPVAESEPSVCPKCGSTQREKYHNVVERPISGIKDGRPYTHIVWRRTTCSSCGQARVDRAHELRS